MGIFGRDFAVFQCRFYDDNDGEWRQGQNQSLEVGYMRQAAISGVVTSSSGARSPRPDAAKPRNMSHAKATAVATRVAST